MNQVLVSASMFYKQVSGQTLYQPMSELNIRMIPVQIHSKELTFLTLNIHHVSN